MHVQNISCSFDFSEQENSSILITQNQQVYTSCQRKYSISNINLQYISFMSLDVQKFCLEVTCVVTKIQSCHTQIRSQTALYYVSKHMLLQVSQINKSMGFAQHITERNTHRQLDTIAEPLLVGNSSPPENFIFRYSSLLQSLTTIVLPSQSFFSSLYDFPILLFSNSLLQSLPQSHP